MCVCVSVCVCVCVCVCVFIRERECECERERERVRETEREREKERERDRERESQPSPVGRFSSRWVRKWRIDGASKGPYGAGGALGPRACAPAGRNTREGEEDDEEGEQHPEDLPLHVGPAVAPALVLVPARGRGGGGQ